MTDLSALLDRWRADEETLRGFGAVEAAQALERCRSELAAWWREWQYEALTLEEASEYSGLATGTLSNKVARGEIPNVGRKHVPRVRRCDLPAKPIGSPIEEVDLADKILQRQV